MSSASAICCYANVALAVPVRFHRLTGLSEASLQHTCLALPLPPYSIRLPALVALVATQIGLLSTSLSLPMLAPLLLGTGMLLRSIRTNASLIFPRIGLLVVLLWLLWFANSVIQNTVAYLRKQVSVRAAAAC